MGNLPRSPPFSFKLYIMALYYQLPVFKDVYKLTLLIYGLTKYLKKVATILSITPIFSIKLF